MTMKKFLPLIACSFFLMGSHPWTAVAAESVAVDVFVREDCTHCQAEEQFLRTLQEERDDITITFHDIGTPEERIKFDAITERAELPKATPVTYIGGVVIQGFSTAETTGKHITEVIDNSQGKDLPTLEEFLIGEGGVTVTRRDSNCDETGLTPCVISNSEYLVHIPFFGAVDLEKFSLPAISALLGFVDGFNPCAMWVLVTFLIVLLQIGDRKKVWQIAGLFVIAEATMYYLILNVWFTTWDFIGLDKYVTPVIGTVAIGAGIFFLYEGIMTDGTCKVTSLEQRRKTHLRIKAIAAMPFTIMSALAVLGLAFSVNIIEFACSIGIPQTFTKILDINGLSLLSRQALMALYILMYMVDDFIVFAVALWSTEYSHITQKYSRASNVIGGILMALLGAILIFNPSLLRFT